MKLLSHTLVLCLALPFSLASPSHDDRMMADHHGDHAAEAHHEAQLDRCDGIEFDAITPDDHGIILFFKGDHVWTGFHGPAKLLRESYKELDEHHHLGHVDAAFRMHHPADPADHDHMFFFLDDKVFSYSEHKLEEGFPKDISKVFPGIPSHLDAAVECPQGECVTDSVLFFKGSEVFAFDTRKKNVKRRPWTHLPACSSVFRWLEHYYCFHGHGNFTRFHPVTGTVVGTYPKDARSYFMRCPKFSHSDDDTERECCSHVHVDAITSDDIGKAYAFRGNYYLRLHEKHGEGWHAFPISSTWKEVKGGVDAAFSYSGKLYLVKGEQVYVYKSGEVYTLLDGYPKPLKEEFGIVGPVDAAFVCGDYEILHVIKGQNMYDIDLSTASHTVTQEAMLPFPHIDAGMCGPDGVKVLVGAEYFHYETPTVFAKSRIRPLPHKLSIELFGCDH